MATLAIKGHATRGSEVIELLEALGGKNIAPKLEGNGVSLIYYIRECYNEIVSAIFSSDLHIVFTLEEFEEKFPYKVGDKVTYDGWNCTVIGMKWEKNSNNILYTVKGIDFSKCACVEDLQPYKEQETLEEKPFECIDFVKLPPITDKFEIILGNYEIVQENGKYYAIKKKTKYPSSYEECCRIVNASPYVKLVYNLADGQTYSYDVDNLHVYENLRRLIIARDAYWKIAGEKMGLGKPWQPDYTEDSHEQGSPMKYVIYYTGTYITKGVKCTPSHIIAFPTAEMRDAFYENFKDLIERCKELL